MIPHISRAHPKHLNPLRSQPSRSSLVVGELISFIVSSAVDFDRQTRSMTVEVEDIGADWMLATKLHPFETAALKTGPQPGFRRRQGAAHSSGASIGFNARRHSPSTTSWSPSPQVGRKRNPRQLGRVDRSIVTA